MNTTTTTLAAALLAAITCQAQGERQGPPGGRPPHPPMAIMQALDADQDHKISAAEIAGAATALKTLDADGNGEISREELKPKPPEGAPAGPPPDEAGAPPEGGGKHARRQGPPVPPVFAVLDEDRDGTISASEIEASPESLAKLDKNGDGELTPRELQPHGPPRGKGPQSGDDE